MMRAWWRAYWMPLLGGLCLLLGALYWALASAGAVPPEGQPVFYPAVLLYNYSAAACATSILLVAITLVAFWIPQALRRLPRFRLNGLAAAAALAATALACLSNVPLFVAGYVHASAAELNGQVYQLGARVARDGDDYYVVCGCGQYGLLCRCRPLREAGAPVFTERNTLVAAPESGTLRIVAGAETVYEFRP